MSFSYPASSFTQNGSAASDTVLATSATMNVAEGDLLVCFVAWYGGHVDTVTVSDSVSNSFTLEDTVIQGSLYGAVGYKINATANAAATFTMTLDAGHARSYRSIMVYRFQPDDDETVTRLNYQPGSGNGTAILTGNLATGGTETDVALFGCEFNESLDATTSPQIGDAAAAASNDNAVLNSPSIWYRLYTGGSVNGWHAQCTHTNTSDWIAGIIAFGSAAGGGASYTETITGAGPTAAGVTKRITVQARKPTGAI